MNEQIRHKKLLALLAQKEILSVAELIEYLQVSPATVRRDITKLNEQGKLHRIRNGVESLHHMQRDPLTQHIVQIPHAEEKQRIAQAAAALCENSESVILTCGTTIMTLGAALRRKPIQIITNYLPLANRLIESNHDNVVIMGGQYNKNQEITFSINASPEYFAANIMFTSGKGLTENGLYKTDMLIASYEQQIAQRAEKLVVLLDSSKLGNAVGLLFTRLEQIDLLITGKEADPVLIEKLRGKGLEIILA
ncbi:DeoR family transcriptional regulator [Mesocricetibacter intestinalis]|uniref:DeoR family transcriptional regulator n=1 Tax=Mesocricetibacter intestinalis TaxID=1521930 RepID=A0A4R6VEU8_9PAST|nr:HTH-type transcriptional regulator UlaR [Mesocricetibacter intestinalis]TDQ59372.1 DeoR family transcriptional regulator [Mesocricetibacter intestinalis]